MDRIDRWKAEIFYKSRVIASRVLFTSFNGDQGPTLTNIRVARSIGREQVRECIFPFSTQALVTHSRSAKTNMDLSQLNAAEQAQMTRVIERRQVINTSPMVFTFTELLLRTRGVDEGLHELVFQPGRTLL